jgi:hypothetical protein
MTDPTFDPRLADRLLDYSRAAVVPRDPVAIADDALAAQRQRWHWPNRRPSRVAASTALSWLAIAVAVGLIVANVAGGFVGKRSGPAQTPSPSPRMRDVFVAIPDPSRTASPPGDPVAERSSRYCLTGRVQVVSGAAMGPVSSTPDGSLVSGQGVLITTTDAATAEIWSVIAGQPTPVRIGEIKGAADWLNVLGISGQGSQALVRIGHYAGPDWSQECANLYLVAVDGTGVRMLTTFGGGQSVIGGAISPDGTRVAYAARSASFAVDVAVVDIATGATVHEPSGCTNGTARLPITVAWSTEIDRFAVACDQPVIFDPTGRMAPVTVAEGQVGIGWDGRSLMVANPPDLTHFRVDAVDPVSGHLVHGPAVATSTIGWANGSGRFAPSGQRLVAEGDVGTTNSTYVMGATTSAPRVILPGSLFGEVDWSTDEVSIIYPEFQDSTLYQVDISNGIKTSLVGLPPGYASGRWRIP